MARYPGGTPVEGGYYWNPRRWTITPVADEGALLPGDAGERYLKVHWALVFLLAPVMGGLFVVLMPFIGFAMLLEWALARAGRLLRGGARDLGATVAPGWRPGEAHLTGGPGEPPRGEVAAGGAGEQALEDVAREIEKRRAGGNGNGKGD